MPLPDIDGELPAIVVEPVQPNDEAPVLVTASGALVRQPVPLQSDGSGTAAPAVTYFGISN